MIPIEVQYWASVFTIALAVPTLIVVYLLAAAGMFDWLRDVGRWFVRLDERFPRP